MMRLGYYLAVQATSRSFVDPAEWDYWIGGKPAAKDLPGAFGDVTSASLGSARGPSSSVTSRLTNAIARSEAGTRARSPSRSRPTTPTSAAPELKRNKARMRPLTIAMVPRYRDVA